MLDRIRTTLITVLGVAMCIYTLVAVNFETLMPESSKALFVLFGMTLCFLVYPTHKRLESNTVARGFDMVLALLAALCLGYIVIQSEPIPWFKSLWWDGISLSNRASSESTLDIVVAFTGLILVLEATRRSIGWIVPAMAITFMAHSFYCYLSNTADGWRLLANVSPVLSGLCLIVALACAIVILIAAFRESRLAGILSLCVPFYIFYFAISKFRSENKSVIVATWIGSIALGWVFHFLRAGLPDWMYPHAGQSAPEIASVAFLQSLGVLGPAAEVMFRYVFLFVVFGAFLEMSGATQFIIDFAERVFGRSPGGPAKVSVLGSGLMGSLSGSAVANAVTTGSFTIPMMRNAGFSPSVAGGITAAAASGGALVPPVMGAGAYMMLEFAKRGATQVTFLEIARAALIPAVLYYFSLFMIVHFFSIRVGSEEKGKSSEPANESKADSLNAKSIWRFEGLVFFGALGVLVSLLAVSFSPFKAVTGALVLILVMTTMRAESTIPKAARMRALVAFLVFTILHQFFSKESIAPVLNGMGENLRWMAGYIIPFLADTWRNPETGNLEFWLLLESLLGSSIIGMLGMLLFGLVEPHWRPEMQKAFTRSAKNGISLVAASACVGIIIGIVQSTPVANEFSETIKGVVESSLLLALIGIMICSIILGMGVPSVVCYLLMATLMGSLLGEMGVDPLAAHLFIFYFGMMSMVTPPVALAAYASASIAEAKVMPTALAAFRFSLVGFTLPFMFVYRPELLLMQSDGAMIAAGDVPRTILVIAAALAGVVALAGGVTGQFFRGRMRLWERAMMFVAAVMLLLPAAQVGDSDYGWLVNIAGAALLFVGILVNRPNTQTR